MPKMKTRRSAAGRYKLTKTGKVKHKKQGTRHILTKKSAKRKRKLRHPGLVSKKELPEIKRMLPYG